MENRHLIEKPENKNIDTIEYYKNFNPDFFHPQSFGLSKRRIQETMNQYPDSNLTKNSLVKKIIENNIPGPQLLKEYREQYFDLQKKLDQIEINKIAQEYSEFLQDNSLKQAFEGKVLIDELPLAIFNKFRKLIVRERTHSGILRNRIDNELPKELSQLSKHQQKYVRGRITAHLYRLFSPRQYSSGIYFNLKDKKINNTKCETFVKDFLAYADIAADPESERNIMRAVGIEGDPVQMFWTIVPYLHDELKNLGNSQEQSMKKIFQWIKEAEESMPASDFGYLAKFKHSDFATEMICHKINYVLGADERMPTHLLTKLLAKQLAKDINSEYII